MSSSDSLGSDSGAIRKSVLLGSRKARSATPDKPVVVTRREPAPSPEPPPEPKPAPKPARKAAAPKKPRAPKKAPADPLLELRAELEQLKALLGQCPTFADLQRLEERLEVRKSSPDEVEGLREQLQNRSEELAELSLLLEESEQRQQQFVLEAEELKVEREHLENLLAETRQDLQDMEERCSELQLKVRRSEGFLRDALLGLLSPGDEFNEDLVEQIQNFLSL